jgi:hypothetical protein
MLQKTPGVTSLEQFGYREHLNSKYLLEHIFLEILKTN